MQQFNRVLITGGGRGIGLGIARCFARQRAKLVLADINGDLAAESAAALGDEGAADAMGISCDVTDRASVQSALDQAVARFGGVDVLVNNAGICPFVDGIEMTPEVWQRTLDVNLNGAFHCTQIVGGHMIERGQGGRIISITSLATNVTGPAQVDYAASKAGLRMMTVGFATSMARHGITCNCVAPGMILTDLTKHYWEQPGPAEEIKKRVPVGRIGTPEDIGAAVVFLASPQAEYINGITLRVDGGHQAVCA
jgi:NAD(P)-dependent dehydrogenase (short-subunit alcohol dehydrogenase family)